MKMTGMLYVELVLLLVAIVWGINPAVMKIGLQTIPPMAYNALRMVVAVGVAWIALALSGTYRPVDRQTVKDLIILSVFGFFIFQLFFTVGVQKTTAGNASLILSLLPVSVAVINRLFKIETISWLVAAGIAVSIAGVVLIVLGSGKETSLSGDHWQGALLLMAAQFGYGYYTVFSKNVMSKYSAYQITAYVITISAALFMIVAWTELSELTWSEIPPVAWYSVLYSGILALCIANFLWIWGVGRLGSAKTSLYNNLSPVFAIVAGYVMLGEPFSLLQLGGGIIIFGGLYLTRLKPGQSASKPGEGVDQDEYGKNV